jgi:hypothetical protein
VGKQRAQLVAGTEAPERQAIEPDFGARQADWDELEEDQKDAVRRLLALVDDPVEVLCFTGSSCDRS